MESSVYTIVLCSGCSGVFSLSSIILLGDVWSEEIFLFAGHNIYDLVLLVQHRLKQMIDYAIKVFLSARFLLLNLTPQIQ